MMNFALSKVELLCWRSLTVMITMALLFASLSPTASAQRGIDPAARKRSTPTSQRGATPAAPVTTRTPIKLAPVPQGGATCNNVIVDGGFETGGIPSTFWDPETSTNFGTPLCDVGTCGTGGGASPPFAGLIWAWFGGIPAPETATLGQTVTIASGATATLTFQMRIGTVSSPFTDVVNVRVDGAIVQSFPEPTVAEGAYSLRTIDLSAFANGAAHNLLFEYIGPSSGSGTGSYVIDDVALNVCTGAPPPAGGLLITEFRVRGTGGVNDEFIEIYNATGADHTVSSGSGTGYGVAASDGVTRCSIPNGTVIPNRGHYLCVNSVGYSLSNYPAGNGTTATGDATYTTDIPDNAGIALFNNNTGGASYVLANRIDAVGSSTEANTLYKEGTGYPALTLLSIDYSFHRSFCPGNTPVFGSALGCFAGSGGLPKDSNANENDFVFVDTNGTCPYPGPVFCTTPQTAQRLGAPGPENLSSPIERNSVFGFLLLDATVGGSVPPNRVRDFTSDPVNNSTFGTLDIRRRIVNNTGAPVTRLRFRVIDITTFPPSGFADLRTRTSLAVVVAGINDAGTCAAKIPPEAAPCMVTVQGTTNETPPLQPNGGAFNSSMSADTITLATPLAPGASVNVRFLLGIQQTGNFRFFLNIEALP